MTARKNVIFVIFLCWIFTLIPNVLSEVIRNGRFTPDDRGEVLPWVKLSDSTVFMPIATGIANDRASALCITDNGGVVQLIHGLKENQSYRLRFRAWRRGADWSPLPTLSLGNVPLALEKRRLPIHVGSRQGWHDDVYTFDQVVRPGEGDFEVRIEVFSSMPGYRDLSHVWLDEISLIPVEEDVPLLIAPLKSVVFWNRAVLRAGREEVLGLQLSNPSSNPTQARVKLVAPEGVEILDDPIKTTKDWLQRDVFASHLTAYGVPRKVLELNPSTNLVWKVRAAKAGEYSLVFEVDADRHLPSKIMVSGNFDPALTNAPSGKNLPIPVPAHTDTLKIGANFYPGWVPGTGWGWSLLDPYPNRKPALGYYDDSNPEIIDWQIKWALEHGISFFNLCWYRERGNEGKPVKVWRPETLHQGLLKSRFLKDFEFSISWENANAAGVSSKEDLLDNVLPFWIENYFKHPSYLMFQGKPVIFIYSIDNLVAQLGGEGKFSTALEVMRAQCQRAGFKGLVVLGEYRGNDISVFQRFKSVGLDGSWSYGMESIEGLRIRRNAKLFNDIATISVGWDPRPWQEYMGYWWTRNWYHSPDDFQVVAAETKEIVETYPKDSIGRHFVLLDNWNEWGEGHYLSPARQAGFGYLEAIRRVFAPTSKKPVNLLPEDVGMGATYEQPYERWLKSQQEMLK